VARRLDVTRENVCIIEHRAWLKIEEARATLAGLQEMATDSEVMIPSGASIYHVVAELLQRADLLGVKLHNSCDDLIAILKSKCKGKIRGHHLVSAVKIEITSNGSISFKTAT
jgi:Tfx family DNA-binding protein